MPTVLKLAKETKNVVATAAVCGGSDCNCVFKSIIATNSFVASFMPISCATYIVSFHDKPSKNANGLKMYEKIFWIVKPCMIRPKMPFTHDVSATYPMTIAKMTITMFMPTIMLLEIVEKKSFFSSFGGT